MPLTRRLTQVRESLPDDGEVKAVKWLQQAEAILICAGDIFTSEADAGWNQDRRGGGQWSSAPGSRASGNVAHNPYEVKMPKFLEAIAADEKDPGSTSIIMVDNRDDRMVSPFQAWLVSEIMANSASSINVLTERYRSDTDLSVQQQFVDEYFVRGVNKGKPRLSVVIAVFMVESVGVRHMPSDRRDQWSLVIQRVHASSSECAKGSGGDAHTGGTTAPTGPPAPTGDAWLRSAMQVAEEAMDQPGSSAMVSVQQLVGRELNQRSFETRHEGEGRGGHMVDEERDRARRDRRFARSTAQLTPGLFAEELQRRSCDVSTATIEELDPPSSHHSSAQKKPEKVPQSMPAEVEEITQSSPGSAPVSFAPAAAQKEKEGQGIDDV
eukprot:s699_g13.t1